MQHTISAGQTCHVTTNGFTVMKKGGTYLLTSAPETQLN